ncbi:MAG: universal stress protein [Mucilaginibacter polytrichastri]|nr:universal stress protein [Mucilaginibacter polytrichastri]
MIIRKILISADSGEQFDKVATAGFDLAHRIDAEVALVHIVEPVVVPNSTENDMFPVEMDLVDAQNTQAKRLLDEIEARFSPERPCTKYIEMGRPSTMVVDFAKEFGADMIVIGTHGRTGLDRLLMGSVAEHVVRHSDVPVLVVPIRETEK